MKILIVDDRPINLKLLRVVLEAEGVVVSEATDGVEALSVLNRTPVDAIISDILMPRMDGYRLCMEVRANSRSCNVPFIAYSATYTSAGDEKLMIELGADRFLRKPATVAVLLGTVREVVQARHGPPPSSRPRPAAELLKACNQRLTGKLEEKRVDLAAKTERLTRAEDDVRTTDAQWQTVIAMAMNAMLIVQDDKVVFSNAAAVRLLAATDEWQLLGRLVRDFLPDEDLAPIVARAGLDSDTLRRARPLLSQRIRCVDGSFVEAEIDAAGFQFRCRPALFIEARDVRGRNGAESRLALQHTVTAAFDDAGSPSEINRRVLAAFGCGLQWDLGEMWMADRSAHVLRRTDVWHLPTAELGAFSDASREVVFTSEQGLPGRVWTSSRVEWCADLAEDAICPRREAARRIGLRGWIGIPIKLRGHAVGVVGFFTRQVMRPDAGLIALFEAFGHHLGWFIERQQLTNQFRQSQKVEALGVLAGGIAHDFNGILTAIRFYCELARNAAAGNTPATEHLDALMDGAMRATALVRQIAAFTTHQVETRRPMQLCQIAGEALRLLRAAMMVRVKFETSLEEDAPAILADATQIHQVLMNLGINAAHAMAEQGGRVIVTLEPCAVDASLAATHPDLRPGSYARFTVTDTGHGMTAETLERIFEPFFTTKPPGVGTGLGLVVVQGIVKSHGGAITVSSELGKGTTFRVYFPAYLPGAEHSVTSASDLPPPVEGGLDP
ncbi:MAG: hypothetical protein JWM88_2004 [Verrucomicrobia bacterium]|nr:hypothetical protein [Verrucomicrobiota bacterium]